PTACTWPPAWGWWGQDAVAQAGGLLGVPDRACRGRVRTLCLEEIFCRRLPLLIAVEPHSMAWLVGQRGPDRTGESWCQALAPWSQLTYAVVDGGSGLRRGLGLVQQPWQQEARLLPAGTAGANPGKSPSP